MTTTEEIWSLLISKAILKFFHFKFKLLELNELNEENESTMTFLYNGDIINSLSGMFTLKYSLIEQHDFAWEYLKMTMSEGNFNLNNFKVILMKTNNKIYKHKTKQRLLSQMMLSSDQHQAFGQCIEGKKQFLEQIFNGGSKEKL